jgi:GxxExxY protein
MKREEKLIYPELSYKIVGVLYATQNGVGRYCNEQQYADFVEQKLKEHKLKYEREKILDQYFDNERRGRHRVDFLIEDKIVLEFKCKRLLEREDYYQVRRYLKVLGLKLGLLVNFREKFLKPRRILNADVDY